jgi:transposase
LSPSRTKGKDKMTTHTSREQKALEIAARNKLTPSDNNKYSVPSQSGRGCYTVEFDPAKPHCNCPDFEYRQLPCKHVLAVEITVRREQTISGDTTTTAITKTVKVVYRQDWGAYNQAQTKEKALFQQLLHNLCQGIVEPVHAKGRPPFSFADMIFASTFKVFSTVSGRRFATDLKEAHVKGYLSRLPHYNSVFRYFEKPALTALLKALITHSAMPLKAIETDFAVDSSGFSTCQYARWFDEKYGEHHQQNLWLKVHLMCGVKTNIITSVEVTPKNVGDSPMFPQLVETTAAVFDIGEVSADKAYSSRKNHNTVAKVGGTPYIAFKENATGGKGESVFQKMFHFYSYNQQQFMANYHKRSNVETTFSMVKAKFGTRLRSKTPVAQVNEALAKVLCHNLCCVIQSMFEFGIEPDFQNTPLN